MVEFIVDLDYKRRLVALAQEIYRVDGVSMGGGTHNTPNSRKTGRIANEFSNSIGIKLRYANHAITIGVENDRVRGVPRDTTGPAVI